MLAAQAFRLRVQCSGCREHIPLNNVMSALQCFRCNEVNTLDLDFWRDVMQRESSSAVTVHRPTVKTRPCEVESSFTAACAECDNPFDLAPLKTDPTTAHVACSAGHTLAVWPADPITAAVFPQARFVIGEPMGQAPVIPGGRLAVLACAGCGAPLTVTTPSRVITCDHCSATNVMADAMSPKSRRFVIVSEDGRPERTDADRRWNLAMTTQSPDKLRELASDPVAKVRKAVADSSLVAKDVLATLAADPDPAVAKAAAANLRRRG